MVVNYYLYVNSIPRINSLSPVQTKQVFLEKFLNELTYASVRQTTFPSQAMFVPVYAKLGNIFLTTFTRPH